MGHCGETTASLHSRGSSMMLSRGEPGEEARRAVAEESRTRTLLPGGAVEQ